MVIFPSFGEEFLTASTLAVRSQQNPNLAALHQSLEEFFKTREKLS